MHQLQQEGFRRLVVYVVGDHAVRPSCIAPAPCLARHHRFAFGDTSGAQEFADQVLEFDLAKIANRDAKLARKGLWIGGMERPAATLMPRRNSLLCFSVPQSKHG